MTFGPDWNGEIVKRRFVWSKISVDCNLKATGLDNVSDCSAFENLIWMMYCKPIKILAGWESAGNDWSDCSLENL